MRRLRRFTAKEVFGFSADEEWVVAKDALEQIRRLEREIALMFPPREMLDVVNVRDVAQKLVTNYEEALSMIATAANRSFRGAEDLRTLPSLVDKVTENLAIADSSKERKKRR